MAFMRQFRSLRLVLGLSALGVVLPLLALRASAGEASEGGTAREVFADYASRAGEQGVREVRLYVDGRDVSDQSSVSAVRVAFIPADPLTPGLHSARVVVIDSLGRAFERSWSFSIEREAPAEVVFYTAALAVHLDPLPRRTGLARLGVAGATLPGAEVEVLIAGSVVGRVIASPAGRFALDLTLDEGLNEIMARAREIGGPAEGPEVTARVVLELPAPSDVEPPAGEAGSPRDPVDAAQAAAREQGARPARPARSPLSPASTLVPAHDPAPPSRDPVDAAGAAARESGARPSRPARGPFAPASAASPVSPSSPVSARGAVRLEAPDVEEAFSLAAAAPELPGLVLLAPSRRAVVLREATLRLEGTAWDGATLEVEVDGQVELRGVAGVGGRFVLALPLPAGRHLVTVVASDPFDGRTVRSPLHSVLRSGPASRKPVRLPEPPAGLVPVRPARPTAPARPFERPRP